MNITDTIQFDESLPLSQQSSDFKTWYYKNVINQITDKTIPDLLDDFNRPVSFTVNVDNFIVTIFWLYIFQDQSNWSCSDFNILIKDI